jgi:hypothetical protein
MTTMMEFADELLEDGNWALSMLWALDDSELEMLMPELKTLYETDEKKLGMK